MFSASLLTGIELGALSLLLRLHLVTSYLKSGFFGVCVGAGSGDVGTKLRGNVVRDALAGLSNAVQLLWFA